MKSKFRMEDFFNAVQIKPAGPPQEKRQAPSPSRHSSSDSDSPPKNDPDPDPKNASSVATDRFQSSEPQETVETLAHGTEDTEEVKVRVAEMFAPPSPTRGESEPDAYEDTGAEIRFDVRQMQEQICQLTKECIEHRKRLETFEDMKKEIAGLRGELAEAVNQNSILYAKINKRRGESSETEENVKTRDRYQAR